MIPVNVTGPRYADASLQVLEELHKVLSLPKRAVGLIVAGIIALVTVLASAATAAAALGCRASKMLNLLIA